MSLRQLQSSSKRAFTLIEIMVATAVMVIMVALVIQITSEVLKVWNRAAGKLSAAAEARIALDLLTTDLETAILRDDGLQWLRAEKEETGLSADPETNTVAIRLFAPVMDRPNTPGDLCAIAYQLVRTDPIDGTDAGDPAAGEIDDRMWILYRLVVDPDDTFNELMGAGNQELLPDKDQLDWPNGSGTASVPILGANGENYLVRNIVDFEIDFYVEDDGDISTPTLVADASGNPVDTIYGGTDATVGDSSTLALTLPQLQESLAYAEIRIMVISDEGAAMLQAVNLTGDDPAEIIREHGEVFTRRVNFMAKPL